MVNTVTVKVNFGLMNQQKKYYDCITASLRAAWNSAHFSWTCSQKNHKTWITHVGHDESLYICMGCNSCVQYAFRWCHIWLHSTAKLMWLIDLVRDVWVITYLMTYAFASHLTSYCRKTHKHSSWLIEYFSTQSVMCATEHRVRESSHIWWRIPSRHIWLHGAAKRACVVRDVARDSHTPFVTHLSHATASQREFHWTQPRAIVCELDYEKTWVTHVGHDES